MNCLRGNRVMHFLSCREAAEAAGFNVLRLIHEPSAALLAYNIGQDFPSGKR